MDYDEYVAALREELERVTRQRDGAENAARQYKDRADRIFDHLMSILSLMPPEPIKAEDGKVYIFHDPDPTNRLRALQDAIRRAGAAVEADRAREIERARAAIQDKPEGGE